jgi:hypothetical protein
MRFADSSRDEKCHRNDRGFTRHLDPGVTVDIRQSQHGDRRIPLTDHPTRGRWRACVRER